MESIKMHLPETNYPYLAVFTGKGGILPSSIEINQVVLISMASTGIDQDLQPYVQKLVGGSPGYFTTSEDEYTPLPLGTTILFTQ